MELKWLEDFVALAETSSFSRAAEMRHVTQPAFSRRIKQLEAWLGVTLMSRATLPADLTPAGESFLPVAQQVIRELYAIRETLRPAAEAGLVRIAALHTLTLTFFPEWLSKLESERRGFGTAFIPDRGGIEANLEAMVMGEADFFLSYAHPEVPFRLDHDKFRAICIGHDRLIPVSAPHLRVGGRKIEAQGYLERALREKLAVPYLSYGHSSFFGVALSRFFQREAALKRRTIHENTLSAGLRTMALMGEGMAWLPQSLVREDLEQGRLLRLAPERDWALDLEIRLYRPAGARGRACEALWQAASQLATEGEITP